jgi:hypothetical protein
MNTIKIGLANGFVLGLLVIVCCAIVFIAYKYVENIEARLSNCSYVNDVKKTWGHAGLLGKVMRGGIIATVLMMPKIHAKRGLVNSDEVKNLQKTFSITYPRRLFIDLLPYFPSCSVKLYQVIVIEIPGKLQATLAKRSVGRGTRTCSLSK